MKKFLTLVYLLSLFCLHSPAQDNVSSSIAAKYLPMLNKIFELHKLVKQIHPVLSNVYPVAIAENGQFYIFEPDSNGIYRFIKQAPVKMSIPQGIKAAFQLEENGGKMTCVVTGDAFNSLEGYAFIFHEFVHCAQTASVEMQLKNNMQIYKRAMEKRDYMWELNFPFPYEDKNFTRIYSALIKAAASNDLSTVSKLRGELKNILSPDGYSYITWEEWKEGFARWIENKVRNKFGINENHGGKEMPFSRTTFYEGGSCLIEYYFKANPANVLDLEKLYSLIKR